MARSTSVLGGPARNDPVFRVGSGPECEFAGELYSAAWVCNPCQVALRVPAKCDEERACPACSKVWAWKEAVQAAARFAWWVKTRNVHLLPRHVVVSPSQGAILRTAGDVSRIRAWAGKVLKRMGMRAAALVVHGERHRGKDCWYDGAHVHGVVVGRVDADRRPEGVFVRTLRGSQRDLRATIAYLLNHATVSPRGHAITWWGEMSYNKSPGFERVRGAPPCPRCGEPMEYVSGDGWEGLCGLIRAYEWDPGGAPGTGAPSEAPPNAPALGDGRGTEGG